MHMANHSGPIQQSKSEKERRALLRRVSNLEVSCSPFAAQQQDSFPATMRDISTDGVGLLLDRQLVERNMIMVNLQNVRGTFAVKKVARVKYIQPSGSEQWILGASFVKKLDKDELEWLLDAPEAF
jgi:hypothetical protein